MVFLSRDVEMPVPSRRAPRRTTATRSVLGYGRMPVNQEE
jgi:hypothetical protein